MTAYRAVTITELLSFPRDNASITDIYKVKQIIKPYSSCGFPSLSHFCVFHRIYCVVIVWRWHKICFLHMLEATCKNFVKRLAKGQYRVKRKKDLFTEILQTRMFSPLGSSILKPNLQEKHPVMRTASRHANMYIC